MHVLVRYFYLTIYSYTVSRFMGLVRWLTLVGDAISFCPNTCIYSICTNLEINKINNEKLVSYWRPLTGCSPALYPSMVINEERALLMVPKALYPSLCDWMVKKSKSWGSDGAVTLIPCFLQYSSQADTLVLYCFWVLSLHESRMMFKASYTVR